MNWEKGQKEDLYRILDFSKANDLVVLPILIKIFKREKIQDCQKFLSSVQNQRHVEQEILKFENSSLLDKEQMLNVGKYNLNIITDILKTIKDHQFNKQNFSLDEYEEIKQDMIIKISYDKKIIEFFKLLIHLYCL
ncbi:unnamed protein product (macronuclear) [Paramecium tetraurelia]|uniref:Uncharacterized protein n=1 Tax=Paramecium tetraurelia TaxID=5888 RepID=A0DXI8_PARTE|nr:uncharacterized protein GSPATT00039829001 [Paramecium tetraurelia]CAK87755.1 unnamed protein product [Paramecium tetraurelia]|eukprot:XP_001455152.1 hypothetical protein (macronuclear) [Paramecium tetraurelia strain d4-2]